MNNRTTHTRRVGHITISQIEAHLSRVTDALKGSLSPVEFKTILLPLYFLKWCSDRFDLQYQRVLDHWVRQGKSREEARALAEEPHSYQGALFVPRQSRWEAIAIQQQYTATRLIQALDGLGQENQNLFGILPHLGFERALEKASLSEHTLMQLIEHFGNITLNDETCSVPDLLGSVYDRLVRDFTSSGGRVNGEFYTPGEVADVLVRLVKPAPGMKVFDPFAGSGGLLLASRRFLIEEGEDPHHLELYGQEKHRQTWALSVLTMLMHGIGSAHLANEDTLLHPQHREEDGSLSRFDRIISNPPFGALLPGEEDMEFAERFPFRPPQATKHGEWLFVQHMLAVLRPGGRIATVLPHGVLFRGGIDQRIRRWLIRDLDAVEAVISLPAGLFYGTGIPACILVMRAPGAKPVERRGQILFINAEAGYECKRGQNRLRPEDKEEIISCFEAYRDRPGYARCVEHKDIEQNGWALTINRYIDRGEAADIPDVRGVWLGCVPKAAVRERAALITGCGLPITALFSERDNRYFQFHPALSRHGIARAVTTHPDVQRKAARMRAALQSWWPGGVQLIATTHPSRLRASLKDSLLAALLAEDMLDERQIAGIFARWWDEQGVFFRLLQVEEPDELSDQWRAYFSTTGDERLLQNLSTAHDAPSPLSALVQDELSQVAWTRTQLEELEQQMAEEEARGDAEQEGESWGMAPASPSSPQRRGEDRPSPLPENTSKRVRKLRILLNTQQKELLSSVHRQLQRLSAEEQKALVRGLMKEDFDRHLVCGIRAHHGELIRTLETWFDWYHEGIAQIEEQRKKAERRVHEFLCQLGYHPPGGEAANQTARP